MCFSISKSSVETSRQAKRTSEPVRLGLGLVSQSFILVCAAALHMRACLQASQDFSILNSSGVTAELTATTGYLIILLKTNPSKQEGGVKVCGDAVLRYLWCSFAVIFILIRGIAVSKH